MVAAKVNTSAQLFQGYPAIACELLAMILPKLGKFSATAWRSAAAPNSAQAKGRQA
jgi:hypothetical protein